MNTDDHFFSRRRFLQAAAAAALPALSGSPAAARIKRPPPGERITIGMIGCGKMANDFHFPTLLSFPDVQIVAVCDVDTNRRLHGKKRVEDAYSTSRKDYHGCADYTDFRQLLARSDIDAVLIATPEHWHAIPIIEACKAGKDVY